MNRPSIQWGKGIDNADVYVYLQQLEKYCDELEEALDKACEFINDITQTCPKDMLDYDVRCDECDDNSECCWKEWLMKDE